MENNILLRDVTDGDLPLFFEYQKDPLANHMAAFTAKDPSDRQAFDTHWARIRASETVLIKTILCDEQVTGSVLSFEDFGQPEVSYWLGRQYWGKGIATRALILFLDIQKTRPLYAHAAMDNLASIRVLEKSGFVITGRDKGFANARGQKIEELIFTLK
jgi:RimJ/RimL family protein N-acetyltransferase